MSESTATTTSTNVGKNALAQAMVGARLIAIRGPNFSGRTDLLRRFCHVKAAGRIYLGPEVYNALSGLATTVRQEIELHAGAAIEATDLMRLLDDLMITPLLEQHPANLSGGEQACVALLCGVALKPGYLAIDCALEQLDSRRLDHAITLLQGDGGPSLCSVVADNRLDEWQRQLPTFDIADLRTGPPKSVAAPVLAPSEIEKIDAVVAPAITIKSLSAGYKNRPGVLENVSLLLEPGRVYALEGPNGSGKSTWAKILCGVIRPTGGEILFGSEHAEAWRFPGRTVGYHLQNPDVALFESTVRGELNAGHSARDIPPRIAHIVDAFGLRSSLEKNPLALPFPVRKRVSLAATIARGTPWVFLDEPTLGADAATIAAMADIMHGLARKGHGVIVVSHSHSFIRMAGDVYLVMEGKSIVAMPEGGRIGANVVGLNK